MSIALRGLAILLLVAAANAACTQLMTEPMCRTKPTFKVAELSSCTLSPLLLPKAWSPGSVYDTPRGKKCCLPTQSSMLCGEVHPFGFELQPTNVVRDFHKVEPKLLKHIEIDDGVLDISTIPLDAQLYVINAHGTAGTDGIPNTAPATKKFLTTLNKAARTANHIKVVIFLSCAVGDSVTRHMEILKEQGDKDPYTTAMNHFLNPRRGLVCDSTISTSGVFIVHVSPLHPLSGNSKSNWLVQAVQALIGTSSDEVRKMVAHISKLIIDPAGLTNIKIGEFITQFKLTSDIKFSQTNAPVFHYCMMKDLDAILTGIAANAVAPYTDLQFRIMMTPYRIDQ